MFFFTKRKSLLDMIILLRLTLSARFLIQIFSENSIVLLEGVQNSVSAKLKFN